jgi:hypothetical protein
MQKQQTTGWFVLKSNNPKLKNSLGYSCTACGVGYVFGDSEPRAFCCNEWKTPPKKTFWSGDLPTVQSSVPFRPTVLQGRRIDFGEGAEEQNAQAGF